eukprot:1499578-Pyramimonas_sp.AAC.1
MYVISEQGIMNWHELSITSTTLLSNASHNINCQSIPHYILARCHREPYHILKQQKSDLNRSIM